MNTLLPHNSWNEHYVLNLCLFSQGVCKIQDDSMMFIGLLTDLRDCLRDRFSAS